jgi:hypothetical protein
VGARRRQRARRRPSSAAARQVGAARERREAGCRRGEERPPISAALERRRRQWRNKVRRGDPGVGDRKGARVEATSFFFFAFFDTNGWSKFGKPNPRGFSEPGIWPVARFSCHLEAHAVGKSDFFLLLLQTAHGC